LAVPPSDVQGFPSRCSLRLAGAPVRGAAGPDPAAPELQRGLLRLPQCALENLHPQGGVGGDGGGTGRGQGAAGGKGAFRWAPVGLLPGRFSTPRTASTTRCCSTSSSGRWGT